MIPTVSPSTDLERNILERPELAEELLPPAEESLKEPVLRLVVNLVALAQVLDPDHHV